MTSVFTYTGGKWLDCIVAKQGSGTSTKYVCTGTVSILVDGLGYWVYSKTAFNLNYGTNLAPAWGGLVGSVIPVASVPHSYNLAAGWNLVGFKPQPSVQSETVTQYLSSITGSYDVSSVWVYDNSASTWIRATPSTSLLPGEAMWILMTAPATLRP